MHKRITGFLAALLLTHCQPNHGDKGPNTNAVGARHSPAADTLQSDDNYIRAIRANVDRINAISRWTKTIEHDLEQSTEGGEAIFYFLQKNLEKVSVREFGETYQALREYYLDNAALSFVFEKEYRYNRPIYWDSVAMRQNKDDEVFDFNKSTVTERRFYFNSGQLIRRLSSMTDTISKQEETTRLLTEYRKLIELVK